MNTAKVTISLEPELLKQIDLLVKDRVFASRSQAVQAAVADQVSRLRRVRLARELAKLNPQQEESKAEEWYVAEVRFIDGLNELLGR